MFHPEHILIAFEASELPPGPWLVFAPHADDETFGMGGSLLKAKDAGIATHVVIVTDGALGGSGADLVATRSSEAQQAGKLLGLESLQFWQVPDREVTVGEALITRALEAIAALQPASVFFPAAMEIHPDHRATGHLVWQALQRAHVSGLSPTPYAYEIGVQNPINMFIDITDQADAKMEVMDVYCSQNSENNYPELVRSLDKGRTFSLPAEVKFAEGYYRFSSADLHDSLQLATQGIIDRYYPIDPI
ncbi:MAG: PIG-L family deacetylase [Pseudohongiellaceae bacterium]